MGPQMSNEKQLSEKGEGLVVCESTSHIVAFPDDPHEEAPDCINPRAAPSASPALVEGERQELLGKEEADAELRGWLAGRKEARAAVAMLISAGSFEELDGLSKAHAVIRDLVPPAALAEQQPRAAPPISLEEQAQPDAQDLTEEEIASFSLWASSDGLRLLSEVKRRRGIK